MRAARVTNCLGRAARVEECEVGVDEIVFPAEAWLVALGADGVDDADLVGIDWSAATRAERERCPSGSLTVAEDGVIEVWSSTRA
jgi:hypothetical protein